MTKEEFIGAVNKKLHEEGYCAGMSEQRIADAISDNMDIIDQHYSGVKQSFRTLQWNIDTAAWNISLCA